MSDFQKYILYRIWNSRINEVSRSSWLQTYLDVFQSHADAKKTFSRFFMLIDWLFSDRFNSLNVKDRFMFLRKRDSVYNWLSCKHVQFNWISTMYLQKTFLKKFLIFFFILPQFVQNSSSFWFRNFHTIRDNWGLRVLYLMIISISHDIWTAATFKYWKQLMSLT